MDESELTALIKEAEAKGLVRNCPLCGKSHAVLLVMGAETLVCDQAPEDRIVGFDAKGKRTDYPMSENLLEKYPNPVDDEIPLKRNAVLDGPND